MNHSASPPVPARSLSGLTNILVVEEQHNPSSSYFILPQLRSIAVRFTRYRIDELPEAGALEGAAVIFVRYIPGNWMRLIETNRARLGALIYFMDDDLLDGRATAGLPLRYRLKLLRLATWRRDWLQRQSAEIWVSSHHLLKKYASLNPALLLPTDIAPLQDVCRVFYHGSASHQAETRWLRPVIEEAISRNKQLTAEIIGGEAVYRLFRGIPRITVVHPMKWQAYQAFLAIPGRHIGLAPLLNMAFNRSRSYTKFLDITRCGAVGIFSPGSIYAEVVRHREEGLIVELDQERWVAAITELAGDSELRTAMLLKARHRAVELSSESDQRFREHA